jgi:hypothetical protein
MSLVVEVCPAPLHATMTAPSTAARPPPRRLVRGLLFASEPIVAGFVMASPL